MSHQLNHVIPSFDQRVIFSHLEQLGCCSESANFEHVVCIDSETKVSFEVVKRTPFCAYVLMCVMGSMPFEVELVVYPSHRVAKAVSITEQGDEKRPCWGSEASWDLVEKVNVFLQQWLDKSVSVLAATRSDVEALCSA